MSEKYPTPFDKQDKSRQTKTEEVQELFEMMSDIKAVREKATPKQLLEWYGRIITDPTLLRRSRLSICKECLHGGQFNIVEMIYDCDYPVKMDLEITYVTEGIFYIQMSACNKFQPKPTTDQKKQKSLLNIFDQPTPKKEEEKKEGL